MSKLKLSTAKVGKYLVLRHFCGRRARNRLYHLGLNPGTEIEVIEHSKLRGPVICKVKGSNIMIGHGLAQQVELEDI